MTASTSQDSSKTQTPERTNVTFEGKVKVKSNEGVLPPQPAAVSGTQSFRSVASSHRYKKSERSHLGTSLSYVYYRLSSEYCAKRRLRIQDRPAGCVLSCTNSSKQQEVPQICLRKQGLPVSVPFGLNTAPQVSTHLGHMVAVYLHRLGISVVPYLDDLLIHYPDRQVLLQHQARLLKTLDLVGFVLNKKKSELDLLQDIQFLGIRLSLDIGVAFLPASKAQEIAARACQLSSLRALSYHQVAQLMGSLNRTSGLIPLGLLYLRLLQCYFHFLPLESLSVLFRRNSRFSRTPPLRAGAPTWGGIPKFLIHGPLWTTSSISVAWNSRR